MSRTRLSAGLALVLAGIVFLLDALAVLDLWAAAGGWWPLLLVVGGIVLLVHWRSAAQPSPGGSVLALLTRRVVVCQDRPLADRRFTVVLGHAELDVREATLGAEGARVTVAAVLGHAIVTVPPGWEVSVEPVHLLGDVEADLLPAPDDAPVLAIRGLVAMGDLHVRVASRVD